MYLNFRISVNSSGLDTYFINLNNINPMSNKSLLILIFFIISPIVLSCGKKKVEDIGSTEELYQDAVKQLNEKKGGFPWVFTGTDYDTVFKELKEIQLREPYSPYAILAELRSADAYFKREEYEQAVIEYEEFLKRHPGHDESSYATYRLALSYYRQIKSPDRDPTSTREAIKWFEYVVNNYPDSPYLEQARTKIIECRNRLAKREIHIGNYYLKRKNFKAAADRYDVVVNEYSDTKHFDDALFLLGSSYFGMGDNDLARATLKRVIEEFPDSEYHGKAERLLQKIESNEVKEATKG